MTALLSSYPRQRPPLPPQWQEHYEKIYKQSREGRSFLYGLTQHLEAWMHRRVAANAAQGAVLEIGGGTLNHLPYEKMDCPYDVVEPFRNLFKDKKEKDRIRRFYSDISEVPLGEKYTRIISIAALEHIENLPICVAKSALLLNVDGVFQAGIPSEGGFLWNVSWRSTVGVSCFLKTRLNYGDLMKHEHVSQASEIIAMTRYFFKDVKIFRFPLPWHHVSLYTYVEAKTPYRERCEKQAEIHINKR